MPRLLMIIGEPASGKSSLVGYLVKDLAYAIDKKPFWHTVYYTQSGEEIAVQLGWRPEFGEGAKFAGTDRLPYDVVKHATKWLHTQNHDNVIVEGDRLANERFIDSAINFGYAVEIVHVDAPEEVLEQRRAGREQDATWTLTRSTKVSNLIEEYQPWIVDTIDGTLDHQIQIDKLYRTSAVIREIVEAQIDRTAGVSGSDQDPE